jgi:hypothetical protein
MKNLIFSFILIVFCFSTLSANPIKYEERLNTLKKIKLLEFMELNEQKGNKLIIILESFDRKKHRLHEKLRKLSTEIDDNYSDLSEKECKDINDKIIMLNDSLATIRIDKSHKIREILTEKEFTRFTLFEHKFVKELRKRLIKRKSRRRNKN